MINQTRTLVATILLSCLVLPACGSEQRPATALLPTITAPLSPSPAASGYTLSGTVSEATEGGSLPVPGAEVQVGVCPARNGAPDSILMVVTDSTGYYRVSNMCAGVTYVWVLKEGYRTRPTSQCDGDCLFAVINGDTTFDILLARR
jgi:hypothetical protein